MDLKEPILGVLQLSTESLLAWLIVAVGLLGFIIAHTVERWYKAVVPGLLSLGIVALGLYFVVRLMQEPADENAPDGGTPTVEETNDDLAGLPETPTFDEPEPITGGTEPTADLKQYVAASVPDLPGNPFHIAGDQALKVTVRLRNNGTKPVRSVTVTCWVPYKPDPSRGILSTPQTFDLERPIQPGEETDVIVTVDDISNPDDCARPQVRVDSAS